MIRRVFFGLLGFGWATISFAQIIDMAGPEKPGNQPNLVVNFETSSIHIGKHRIPLGQRNTIGLAILMQSPSRVSMLRLRESFTPMLKEAEVRDMINLLRIKLIRYRILIEQIGESYALTTMQKICEDTLESRKTNER
jgi:hypothetical protein